MHILYTHTSSLIGGGNKVLLRLFENLDRTQVQPISIIPTPGPVENELRRLDVPTVVLNLLSCRLGRFGLSVLAARMISRAIRDKIRLLHANDPWTYRAASLGLCLTKIPRICHIHHPSEGGEGIRWAFSQQPQLVITPSYFMRDQIRRKAAPNWHFRTETVWNPVDVDSFRPIADVMLARARLGLNPKWHNIMILVALTPHKGHECFLRMAALVRRELPNTYFHVVGSTKSGNHDYAGFLRSMVMDLNLQESVRFWGFINDDVVRDILTISDLFVLPSREEGFGLSLAEAQACQVPVLTSAIPPLDEIVNNGTTGYLIESTDHEQFSARAIQLLNDEVLRRHMGEAGRKWVVKRFSTDAFVQRVVELYGEVLADNNRVANERV
jgi:glycosyltransferase involved in cell wall biosynthesis